MRMDLNPVWAAPSAGSGFSVYRTHRPASGPRLQADRQPFLPKPCHSKDICRAEAGLPIAQRPPGPRGHRQTSLPMKLSTFQFELSSHSLMVPVLPSSSPHTSLWRPPGPPAPPSRPRFEHTDQTEPALFPHQLRPSPCIRAAPEQVQHSRAFQAPRAPCILPSTPVSLTPSAASFSALPLRSSHVGSVLSLREGPTLPMLPSLPMSLSLSWLPSRAPLPG